MSIICHLTSNHSELSSWLLNGVLNSTSVDSLSFQISNFQKLENGKSKMVSVPDKWLKASKWENNVLLESMLNSIDVEEEKLGVSQKIENLILTENKNSNNAGGCEFVQSRMIGEELVVTEDNKTS